MPGRRSTRVAGRARGRVATRAVLPCGVHAAGRDPRHRLSEQAGKLQFFTNLAALTERKAVAAYLAPLRKRKWYVNSKPPFGGPEAVLAYLSRYTHRVAISNRRLIAANASGVTFKYKDYRIKGPGRYKTMTLATHEFIRRLLLH